MTGQTIILTGPTQRLAAIAEVMALPDNTVLTFRDADETRTVKQNRLLHKWFADIATALGDQSAAEVKVDCNLKYGRPIKARDNPDWEAVFGFVFRGLDIEKKRKAVLILDIPFTRDMTVKQLREYMDQMQRDYAAEGIALTDPDALKYEAEFGATND